MYHLHETEGAVPKDAVYRYLITTIVSKQLRTTRCRLDNMNRGNLWGAFEDSVEKVSAEYVAAFFELKSQSGGLDKMHTYMDYLLKKAAKVSGLDSPASTPPLAVKSEGTEVINPSTVYYIDH